MPLHILRYRGEKRVQEKVQKKDSILVGRTLCVADNVLTMSASRHNPGGALNSGARKHKIAHNAYSKCAQLTLWRRVDYQETYICPFIMAHWWGKWTCLLAHWTIVEHIVQHFGTHSNCFTANTATLSPSGAVRPLALAMTSAHFLLSTMSLPMGLNFSLVR